MHRPQRYSDRLEVQRLGGKDTLVRVVTAYWKCEEIDIYSEDENGNCLCRNLYSSIYCGYVVAFPGQRMGGYGSYYGNELAEVEDWCETGKIKVFGSRELIQEEINAVIFTNYDFKYVLKKWKGATIADVIKALPFWKEHKEIEFLLALGFEKIAFNKSFHKLSDKKKKEIIKWILQNKTHSDVKLQDVQKILKHKMSWSDFESYKEFCARCYKANISVELWKYLSKNKKDDYTNYRLYTDYMQLAEEAGHDIKEIYWKWPKDLRQAHTKVLSECEAIRKAKEIEKRKLIEDGMKKVTKKFLKFNTSLGDYQIFITNDMDIWNRQADVLHQCIVRCNYYNKVAKGEVLIVFIQQDEKPIATAEIRLKEWTIGQFYADEQGGPNGENIHPTQEVSDVFYEWFGNMTKKLKKAA